MLNNKINWNSPPHSSREWKRVCHVCKLYALLELTIVSEHILIAIGMHKCISVSIA